MRPFSAPETWVKHAEGSVRAAQPGDSRTTGNGPGLRAQWLVCTILCLVGNVFSLQSLGHRVLSYMHLALAGRDNILDGVLLQCFCLVQFSKV